MTTQFITGGPHLVILNKFPIEQNCRVWLSDLPWPLDTQWPMRCWRDVVDCLRASSCGHGCTPPQLCPFHYDDKPVKLFRMGYTLFSDQPMYLMFGHRLCWGTGNSSSRDWLHYSFLFWVTLPIYFLETSPLHTNTDTETNHFFLLDVQIPDDRILKTWQNNPHPNWLISKTTQNMLFKDD